MRSEIAAGVYAPPPAASELFRRGTALVAMRNIKAALTNLHSAQQLGYDAKECAAARWNCWMLLGEFERAWQESDFISAVGGNASQFWDGQLWDGRRVMLRCLHGLGDTIQFIRYAPLLKESCRSLFVQTHPQLVNFISGVSGVDRVFTWGSDYHEDFSTWDMQMEVTELPRAFRTILSSIPSFTPYVHLPEEQLKWASRWFKKQEGLRVGIAWEAGAWDCMRSISLAELSPLLAMDSCRFYGLQKGVDPAALRECGTVDNVECHAADIRDTAALILNLDLVITVDTMTAHLAGALARPVWILLPVHADWRWMLERSDTPWYPTARLFRQKSGGDWQAAIADVCRALTELTANKKGLSVSRNSGYVHLPNRLVKIAG